MRTTFSIEHEAIEIARDLERFRGDRVADGDRVAATLGRRIDRELLKSVAPVIARAAISPAPGHDVPPGRHRDKPALWREPRNPADPPAADHRVVETETDGAHVDRRVSVEHELDQLRV